MINPANDHSSDLDGFDMAMWAVDAIKEGMLVLMHKGKVVYSGPLEGASDPDMVFDAAIVSPRDGARFKAYCDLTGQDGIREVN